jgi:hypothetical protein
MAKQARAEKIGRPKLPKGEAEVWIVPVGFSDDEVQRITAAASARNQKVSVWIRSTLNGAGA